MQFVPIKPLSVNEAWKGRRFKTDKYNKYQNDLLFMLPKISLPSPPFSISLVFGVSGVLSDFDNPIKPFVDVLQKKYGFNDRDIVEAKIKKQVVKKGREFVGFEITTAFENA